jgi:hypothetical protein
VKQAASIYGVDSPEKINAGKLHGAAMIMLLLSEFSGREEHINT